MTPTDFARAGRDAALARLFDLLRIPSVSTDPTHAPDVRHAAEWLAERLRQAGADTVRVDPTAGHPVVYAERIVAPGAPTALVYGHYDVQPPDPVDLWTTPPFEPTVRGGAVYARGASDDKGQSLAHVEALAAYRGAGAAPPVNLKYVFEGEEEIGSAHLADWVRAHAGELAADVAVISDTAMVAAGQPSIIYGLRGLAYLEVEVTGPARDLHSGQFGGAVRNPANALCAMIAALHDAEGRVAIPGFYDAVRPLGEGERAELARVPFDAGAFRQATGAAGNWGEAGYSVVERIGARPTLDVNGMWSGWTGPGAKTVLPAKASAKVSMRLVPDQDPEAVAALFAEHIRRLAPPGLQVVVTNLHGGQPAIIDRGHPAVRAAARAYGTVWGRAPVFAREGGTIPVVALLHDILGLSAVMLGFGLPDDNLHAPNEKFEIEHYHKGIETVIAFLDALPGELA